MSTAVDKHNAALRQTIINNGETCVPYPIGHITGPEFDPYPWSCSVRLAMGQWIKRSFKTALEANTWALNYVEEQGEK